MNVCRLCGCCGPENCDQRLEVNCFDGDQYQRHSERRDSDNKGAIPLSELREGGTKSYVNFPSVVICQYQRTNIRGDHVCVRVWIPKNYLTIYHERIMDITWNL